MVVKKDSKALFIIATILVIIIGVILASYIKQKKEDGVGNNVLQENNNELKGEEGCIPSDFPVYPNTTLESSYTTEGDNKATSIVWKTDASLSQVSSFYKSELENTGWAVTSNIENEDSTSFSFERDTKFGIIGIGRGEGGLTVISVTIGSR